MPLIGVIDSAKSNSIYGGSYFSLATAYCSTNTSTMSFSGIPSGYDYLQLRVTARSTRSSGTDLLALRMNGDTSNGYADWTIYGDGQSANSDSNGSSQNRIDIRRMASQFNSTNTFSNWVIDIHNYTSTSIYKDVKALGGFMDYNATASNNQSAFVTGVWESTTAVTQIDLICSYPCQSFVTGSRASLFGIKG